MNPGGQATARKLRQAALARYYSDPVQCKECGQVIPVLEGNKVSVVRRKQFCNRSCANRFNNTRTARLRPDGQRKKPSRVQTRQCVLCSEPFKPHRTASGRWSLTKRCLACRACYGTQGLRLLGITKGALFAKRRKPPTDRTKYNP